MDAAVAAATGAEAPGASAGTAAAASGGDTGAAAGGAAAGAGGDTGAAAAGAAAGAGETAAGAAGGGCEGPTTIGAIPSNVCLGLATLGVLGRLVTTAPDAVATAGAANGTAAGSTDEVRSGSSQEAVKRSERRSASLSLSGAPEGRSGSGMKRFGSSQASIAARASAT